MYRGLPLGFWPLYLRRRIDSQSRYRPHASNQRDGFTLGHVVLFLFAGYY